MSISRKDEGYSRKGEKENQEERTLLSFLDDHMPCCALTLDCLEQEKLLSSENNPELLSLFQKECLMSSCLGDPIWDFISRTFYLNSALYILKIVLHQTKTKHK